MVWHGPIIHVYTMSYNTIPVALVCVVPPLLVAPASRDHNQEYMYVIGIYTELVGQFERSYHQPPSPLSHLKNLVTLRPIKLVSCPPPCYWEMIFQYGILRVWPPGTAQIITILKNSAQKLIILKIHRLIFNIPFVCTLNSCL